VERQSPVTEKGNKFKCNFRKIIPRRDVIILSSGVQTALCPFHVGKGSKLFLQAQPWKGASMANKEQGKGKDKDKKKKKKKEVAKKK
jgi:hypothetical protein